MGVNLLDLVSITPATYNKWQKVVEDTLIAETAAGRRLDLQHIPEENARVDGDGVLIIFSVVNRKEVSLTVPSADWVVNQFVSLQPEAQAFVVQSIASVTPRDRRSRGEYWQGKIFDHIEAKGYISPDGKVLRFQYSKAVFQVLLQSTVFGYSLGDAAPDWARSQ